jgi:hypothetical protein
MLGLQDSRTARHIAAEQAQLNTAGFAQPDHPQDGLWHDILCSCGCKDGDQRTNDTWGYAQLLQICGIAFLLAVISFLFLPSTVDCRWLYHMPISTKLSRPTIQAQRAEQSHGVQQQQLAPRSIATRMAATAHMRVPPKA